MEIRDLDARLRRLSDTLTHLLAGDFAAIGGYGDVDDDPLGRIEETVQNLVMDIKTVSVANRDKEASLQMQEAALAESTEMLAEQRRHIAEQQQELALKAETIARQAIAIRELSTPILEVWDDVMVMPIVGIVDTHRSAEIMGNLLDRIVATHTRWVILDITGVEIVDTRTADYLIKMVQAAGLLGTECLLCGLKPGVAQALVDLGVDLGEIDTKRNLKQALTHCLRQMRRDGHLNSDR